MSTFGEELDHTPFDFGQYAGRTPSDVAEDDPSYIVWVARELPGVVSPALAQACLQDVNDNEEWMDDRCD